jgi:hypothetical protein
MGVEWGKRTCFKLPEIINHQQPQQINAILIAGMVTQKA